MGHLNTLSLVNKHKHDHRGQHWWSQNLMLLEVETKAGAKIKKNMAQFSVKSQHDSRQASVVTSLLCDHSSTQASLSLIICQCWRQDCITKSRQDRLHCLVGFPKQSETNIWVCLNLLTYLKLRCFFNLCKKKGNTFVCLHCTLWPAGWLNDVNRQNAWQVNKLPEYWQAVTLWPEIRRYIAINLCFCLVLSWSNNCRKHFGGSICVSFGSDTFDCVVQVSACVVAREANSWMDAPQICRQVMFCACTHTRTHTQREKSRGGDPDPSQRWHHSLPVIREKKLNKGVPTSSATTERREKERRLLG